MDAQRRSCLKSVPPTAQQKQSWHQFSGYLPAHHQHCVIGVSLARDRIAVGQIAPRVNGKSLSPVRATRVSLLDAVESVVEEIPSCYLFCYRTGIIRAVN